LLPALLVHEVDGEVVPPFLREQQYRRNSDAQAQAASRLLAVFEEIHPLVGNGELPVLVSERENAWIGGGYGSFGVGGRRRQSAAAVDRLAAGDAAQQSRRDDSRKESRHHEKYCLFHGGSSPREN